MTERPEAGPSLSSSPVESRGNRDACRDGPLIVGPCRSPRIWPSLPRRAVPTRQAEFHALRHHRS